MGLATLITIMLLGHWSMRSIAQAQGALSALADLLPDTAERVTDEAPRRCRSAIAGRRRPARPPGARIPADGGSSTVPPMWTSR